MERSKIATSHFADGVLQSIILNLLTATYNASEEVSQKWKYDVIVVGAGLAGLSTGAMLAKARKKVLILEKNKDVGAMLERIDQCSTIELG